MMRKILYLFICVIHSSLAQSDSAEFKKVMDLIDSFSYKNEIAARKIKEPYSVLVELEEIICNDSVYSKFSKEELLEISHLYLMKRAIGIDSLNNKEPYLCNMRLWPTDLCRFSINTILDYNPNGEIPVKDLVRMISDYVSLDILLEYSGSNSDLFDQFKLVTSKYTCE